MVRLVTTESIESQAQLRLLLLHAGYDVTQATISRDLEAIGAVKVREGGPPGIGSRILPKCDAPELRLSWQRTSSLNQ